MATEKAGEVTGLLVRPPKPWLGYLLAHGAGAGMRHRFMERVAGDLCAAGVATFRFNFPYMEAGRRRPDPAKTLRDTIRSAAARAHAALPNVPWIAGGKSMGGRMTSQAVGEQPLPWLRGLVFLGFPLHPPKKPGIERAAHLADVDLPMLFIQGDRDALAHLDLLEPVIDGLGARARLRIVRGGDHSFAVLERSGRTVDEVHDEIVRVLTEWGKNALRV